MDICEKIRAGNIRVASRLIRDLEDGVAETRNAMKQIFPYTGKAHVIGLTGSPGAGKSTLIDGVISNLRKKGSRVGVLAIDPTSPFSGGAVLGDRIRMQRHAEDSGVFIRSLASRGSLGGLSRAAADAIHVMDAMGMDFILIETVGAGQQEVDIINHAHTILVVLVPGMGDEIQTMKAGIMEIADMFIINKAHFEGTGKLHRELMVMIDMAPLPPGSWRPSILQIKDVCDTSAFENGIDELTKQAGSHLQFLLGSDHMGARLRRRTARQLNEALASAILEPVLRKLTDTGELKNTIEKLLNKETDPITASEGIAAKYTRL